MPHLPAESVGWFITRVFTTSAGVPSVADTRPEATLRAEGIQINRRQTTHMVRDRRQRGLQGIPGQASEGTWWDTHLYFRNHRTDFDIENAKLARNKHWIS